MTATAFYARTFAATTRHIIRPDDQHKTLCGHWVALPEVYTSEQGVEQRPEPWMILDLPPCKSCEKSAAKRGLAPASEATVEAPAEVVELDLSDEDIDRALAEARDDFPSMTDEDIDRALAQAGVGVENLLAPAQHTTREAWLVDAVDALRPLFAEVGEEVPAVRVSVGWPGGATKRRAQVIGQCWASWTAADKVAQVFVSPVLDDAEQVLSTLAHELVHAVDDCQSGHKGNFAKIAKGIGLAGKMTATHAGDALKGRLAQVAEELGAYPHAKLSQPSREGAGEKKQTTRMLKVECGDCGYTARTTKKWLEDVGAPICPCNREPMTEA